MLVTQWYIFKNWVGTDKSWKKSVFLFPVGWPRLEETEEKNRFRHHLQTRLFLNLIFFFPSRTGIEPFHESAAIVIVQKTVLTR
jgi:hypothetical protein